MSERENEFDNTGGNYPDQGGADEDAMQQTAADSPTTTDPAEDAGTAAPAPVDGSAPPAAAPSHEAVGIGVASSGENVGTEHYGQDEGRETLTVSETQQQGLSGAQEQRLPAMAQNNAPEVDKVAGIVAQTRSDVATEPHDRIVHVLRQRLEQSGIHLPDDEVAELARQVSTG